MTKCGIAVLRWSLGVVILIEVMMFVLPGAAHDFARTHMPAFVRMVLGFGEIPGSLAAAGSVCDGDSDSSAAWVVRGGESGDLRGGGLCDCGRKELIHGNAIGTSCAAGQPYGKL